MGSARDSLISIYLDMPAWSQPIRPDDFVVAIGKTRTNSVYHVVSVRSVDRPAQRVRRDHLKVLRSDLITAIQRGPDQRVITLSWYPRTKKPCSNS